MHVFITKTTSIGHTVGGKGVFKGVSSLRFNTKALHKAVYKIFKNKPRYILYGEALYKALHKAVTEPHRRGLHRRAPCSRVYLAYSLRQLRVGISPPYALDPYD